eukprot:5547130-Amphidinium_carterae.1
MIEVLRAGVSAAVARSFSLAGAWNVHSHLEHQKIRAGIQRTWFSSCSKCTCGAEWPNTATDSVLGTLASFGLPCKGQRPYFEAQVCVISLYTGRRVPVFEGPRDGKNSGFNCVSWLGFVAVQNLFITTYPSITRTLFPILMVCSERKTRAVDGGNPVQLRGLDIYASNTVTYLVQQRVVLLRLHHFFFLGILCPTSFMESQSFRLCSETSVFHDDSKAEVDLTPSQVSTMGWGALVIRQGSGSLVCEANLEMNDVFVASVVELPRTYVLAVLLASYVVGFCDSLSTSNRAQTSSALSVIGLRHGRLLE